MFLIRDVFQAKPGQAKHLVAKFKETVPIMKKEGFGDVRILTDFVGSYWTVVMEVEVDDLSKYTNMVRGFTSRPDVEKIMKGYMDHVTGGHREIFKVE